jgi:hypothetical protein
MTSYVIQRQPSTDQGTLGEWFDSSGSHLCYTIERPATGIDHPCIDAGEYTFNQYTSPTKGDVWLRDDASADDRRTMIEIHPANTYLDLLGCIGVGSSIGEVNGLPAVLSSKNTFAMLKSVLPDTFKLIIKNST